MVTDISNTKKGHFALKKLSDGNTIKMLHDELIKHNYPYKDNLGDLINASVDGKLFCLCISDNLTKHLDKSYPCLDCIVDGKEKKCLTSFVVMVNGTVEAFWCHPEIASCGRHMLYVALSEQFWTYASYRDFEYHWKIVKEEVKQSITEGRDIYEMLQMGQVRYISTPWSASWMKK